MSNKYGQKRANTAKKSATDAIKTASIQKTADSKNNSKRAIQKTAEATGYLVGNKIAGKITSTSKNLRDEKSSSTGVSNEIPKEIYISPTERQQIVDELRLIK